MVYRREELYKERIRKKEGRLRKERVKGKTERKEKKERKNGGIG